MLTVHLHGHFLVPTPTDHHVTFSLETLLDEPEQMFVVHAGGCMDVGVNFPDIVEISVRDLFLGRQLSEIFEKSYYLSLNSSWRMEVSF